MSRAQRSSYRFIGIAQRYRLIGIAQRSSYRFIGIAQRSSYRLIGIAQRSSYRFMCLTRRPLFLSAAIFGAGCLEGPPPLPSAPPGRCHCVRRPTAAHAATWSTSTRSSATRTQTQTGERSSTYAGHACALSGGITRSSSQNQSLQTRLLRETSCSSGRSTRSVACRAKEFTGRSPSVSTQCPEDVHRTPRFVQEFEDAALRVHRCMGIVSHLWAHEESALFRVPEYLQRQGKTLVDIANERLSLSH